MNFSNLPPGVTASMLPGNRAQDIEAEAVALALFDAFHRATLAGFSVPEVLQEWNDAACQAAYEEQEAIMVESEAIRQAEGTEDTP